MKVAFSGWYVETGAFMMHKEANKQNLQWPCGVKWKWYILNMF